MMKLVPILMLLMLIVLPVFAQTNLAGKVVDQEGNPVTGANIYLQHTYDGTASGPDGSFQFSTHETGPHLLMVTAVGYKEYAREIDLSEPAPALFIQLSEEIKRLDDLVISAGTFEASDEKKAVVLNQMDVLTTAGATADIPSVLNTLPGTQTVAESGRLFVRGGDGEETRTFIDGMLVDKPYSLTPQNIPSRMRFSPFLFSGTTFSTGGYSAEYGQALSGTLLLEMDDDPIQTQSDISLMSVGGGISHTQVIGKSSVFLETFYSNLSPYFSLVPQFRDWGKAPESFQGTFAFRHKLSDKGRYKIFYTNDLSNLSIRQPSYLDVNESMAVRMKNAFHHANMNYDGLVNDHWAIKGGLSLTLSNEHAGLDSLNDRKGTKTVHAKFVTTYDRGGMASLKMGMDHYWFHDERNLATSSEGSIFDQGEHEFLPGFFLESDLYFTQRFIGRAGIRAEYSLRDHSLDVMPRLSLAYKTGTFSQVSLATGLYKQRPARQYLLVNDQLSQEEAAHMTLNYQHIRDRKVIRLEVFQKSYDRLVRYNDILDFDPEQYNNTGYGMARGVEVFWRDGQSIRNADYWISYSFLDTKRLYQDYPVRTRPGFASAHNFSAVYKQFFARLNSQVGATYSFVSGRPYHDPNLTGFQNSTMPAYHDLSMNWSYLVRTNFIIHLSVTNVLGLEQSFGRKFSLIPNEQGIYESIPVRSAAKRFIFLGAFLTLSKDKRTNQLNNL
jgi:hypothetical protein